MFPRNQRTLKKEIVLHGIGTHTGEDVVIKLLPAKPNTGVVFVNDQWITAADLSSIGDSNSNTTLAIGGSQVMTVEHLLSCLSGLFVDNVEVEIPGKELPIGDGSASIFYKSILEAGIVEQAASRVLLRITKASVVSHNNNFISIAPSDRFIIHCGLNWHPRITSSYTYTHRMRSYADIAYARTFASEKYIKMLQSYGHAMGSKEGENYIDIDKGATRTPNEFIKHKVLDILGDFALLPGMYILGVIHAVNSGHKMHHELMKGMMNGVN